MSGEEGRGGGHGRRKRIRRGKERRGRENEEKGGKIGVREKRGREGGREWR